MPLMKSTTWPIEKLQTGQIVGVYGSMCGLSSGSRLIGPTQMTCTYSSAAVIKPTGAPLWWWYLRIG